MVLWLPYTAYTPLVRGSAASSPLADTRKFSNPLGSLYIAACICTACTHLMSSCPLAPAASVLWLPYTAYTLLVRSSAASSSPLADTGEVLLLMLACHAPAAALLPPNPFRQALQRLQVLLQRDPPFSHLCRNRLSSTTAWPPGDGDAGACLLTSMSHTC